MTVAEHSSDASYTLGLAITFMVFCPFIAALRFFTRLHVNHKASLGPDDWLIVPATVLTIACSIVLIIGVRMGVLGHPVDPENEGYDFLIAQQTQWAFLLMHIPAIGCIKLSFLFFYRRIFCINKFRTPFEIATALVIALILVWNMAFFFWMLFSCSTHFSARWTSTDTYVQYCGTDDIDDLGLSISDFLTDLIVIALPVPIVMKLHMNLKRKVLVLGVFALGLVALVVSTVRMVFFIYVIRAANSGNTGILGAGDIIAPDADNNLLTTETLYWSMLEQGLGLIACCLPTLHNLVSQRGVRSIVASARSLQSVGSKTISRRGQEGGGENALRMSSMASSSFVLREGSIANGHIHAQSNIPEVPKLTVRVDHTIEQTTSVV